MGATRWTDRIVSTSGDWSGNVFDFVIEALRRMQQGLKIPFVLKGNQEKIIQELKKNPNLTRKQLTQLVSGISEDGIKYHLTKLQEKGIIRRIGPDKGGHWEVI